MATDAPEREPDFHEITERDGRILEAYGPLEMARIIAAMADELEWIAEFADIRSQDESKVFARVNRGALRTIRDRATAATIPPERTRAAPTRSEP